MIELYITFNLSELTGVVHENPQIGSDGESEEGSRHSDTAATTAAQSSMAATATSSSSELYSSRGAGGSGEGKGSFSGEKEH